MKLKNKKTGEIKEVSPIAIGGFRSLAELNEEWEDYEEVKEHWYINAMGLVFSCNDLSGEYVEKLKRIGNYFETIKEAKRAVECLRAWKRLEDNGFKFRAYQLQELNIKFWLDHGYTGMKDDLDLLFGSKE